MLGPSLSHLLRNSLLRGLTRSLTLLIIVIPVGLGLG
jgi:hypothetical protein